MNMRGNVHGIMDEIANAHGSGKVVALRSGKALLQEEKHFRLMRMERPLQSCMEELCKGFVMGKPAFCSGYS